LQLLKRIERSEYDAAPLDSNKLGIFFSPQTMINDDIIAQLGYTELDSYIGDPSEAEADEYPRLERRAQDYWKKYNTRNNINEYIRVFTLFDLSFFKQLEQLLPARVDKMTGLLIQPNLLERNKQSILATIQREYQQLSFELSGSAHIIEADYTVETALIDLASDTLINADYTVETASIDLASDTLINSELNTDLQINIELIFNTNLSGSVINSIALPTTGSGLTTNSSLPGVKVLKDGLVKFEFNPSINSNYIATITPFASIDDALFFYITSEANGRYDGTTYKHQYFIYSGSTFITGSSPYGISDGVFHTITGSVHNPLLKKIETFVSGGIKYTISSSATVTGFQPTGYMNSKYNGSKMTSAGFNIDSPDTYQGKPVVEIIEVNPNVININPATPSAPVSPDTLNDINFRNPSVYSPSFE